MRTAVLEETNDVFISALGRKNLQRRGQLGRRSGHAAISQFLASLRRFFRDLQTKAHAVGDAPARRIPRRFDPREALATPNTSRKHWPSLSHAISRWPCGDGWPSRRRV